MPSTYTEEPLKWIIEHLVPGCTGVFTKPNGEHCPFIITSEGVADFGPGKNRSWLIEYKWRLYRENLSSFAWPNGNPMLPGQEYDGTGKEWNPIIHRVQSLENRFKQGTLRKVKVTPLPLGA